MYPRLTHGECVHYQHKLDSVVDDGAQGQRKIYSILASSKKNKGNLSELDSENEAANFTRFFVIESLEEVCLAIFSPSLIDKDILKGSTENL